MDQYPAQDTNLSDQTPKDSPVRKSLPFILAGVLVILVLLTSLILFSPSPSSKKSSPTPTPRPTATPLPPPPTLPAATKSPASVSATVSATPIGRLAFIKNGDIYNSDLTSFSLLAKNATPAGDRLVWSPLGNFLSWRPASSATPSAVTIYDRRNKTSFAVKPSNESEAELIDYAWSLDEKQIAILYRDQGYHIDLVSRSSSPAVQLLPLLNRASAIKQIFWPNNRTIIFSGEDGISSLDISNPTPKLLVDKKEVLRMKLSPDKTKLLYSIGTDKKSDLYIISIDGSGVQLVPAVPAKIDMGTANLPAAMLNNGFIPYALWFAKGDKLMVGYHYLTNLPLVGIYDLDNNSFSALSPFSLYESDFMVDELRLMGARVNTFDNPPTWQISFFTIEDNAKLATVRVIPDASSPAFFGDDLLPSGNTF